MMEKSFEWRDLVSYKQCARNDGSIYGTADKNQCRIGVEVSISDVPASLRNHEIFSRLNETQAAGLNAALVDLHQALTNAGYQEDAMSDWTEAQERMLRDLNASGSTKGVGDKAYTGDEVVEKAQDHVDKIKKIMIDKMPTHLDNGAGEFTQASLSMKPVISAAQLKWRDPVLGDAYGSAQYTREQGIKTAERKADKAEKLGDTRAAVIYRQRIEKLKALPEGATIVVKNGVAASRFSQWQEGNAAKMLAYKEKEERAGRPWPTPETAQPSKAEVDALVKNNPKMWTSGFNIQNKARGRDDAFDVYELGSKNPSPQALAARDRKNRAMAESYLAHEGRSPVTGEPIKLPKSNLPTTKTVVDHVTGYRDIVKANPGKSIFELDSIANTRTNFAIVEADLNNSKGERSWKSTADTLARNANTAAVRKGITDNWNDNGSRVTMSERQYRQRFGNTDGFTDARQRQAIASAHEQKRLTGIFGGKQSEMVPTARNRNSAPVSNGFTPPKGTVPAAGTGGKAAPPSKRGRPSTQAPKPKPKTSRRPSTQAPKTSRRKSAGMSQTEKDRIEAGKRAKAAEREAKAKAKKIKSIEKDIKEVRKMRDGAKPGSPAYKTAVAELKSLVAELQAER